MNQFERATVSIDWDFGNAPPAIRCPMTGEVVLAGYDPETGEYFEDIVEPEYEKIPTVTFAFIEEIGEFSFIRDDIQQAIDDYRKGLPEEDSELVDDFEILSEGHVNLGRSPLVFSLTTHGMACGPVSSTVWVGLDLAALGRDED